MRFCVFQRIFEVSQFVFCSITLIYDLYPTYESKQGKGCNYLPERMIDLWMVVVPQVFKQAGLQIPFGGARKNGHNYFAAILFFVGLL